MTRRRLLQGTATLTAGGLGLTSVAACGREQPSTGATELDYWLWDANQLPVYSAAIDRFMEKNPDIVVRITQIGGEDYWGKLTASFVAEAGPDAFVNHVSHYPGLVPFEVIAPLDEIDALADLSSSMFQEGLQKLWTGPDGTRFGVPKDYDAAAIMYDRNLLEEEGLTPEDLENLDWNPEDGGTFERLLARLALDANGVHGDEDGFDPSRVVRYGLAADTRIDFAGQTSWAPFALSTGWTFTNAETWGTRYNYDDERFIATMDWFFGLVDKGLFPAFGMFGDSASKSTQLQAGKGALALDGSWTINSYSLLEGIDLGIAALPTGPVGTPVSTFNGLADSISSQSKHKEEAGRLISFLASDEAQTLIGERSPFFPATDSGTDASISSYASRDLDVTPFTDRVKNQETSLLPVTANGASVDSIMQPAIDRLWMRQIDAKGFASYNDRVNALFE